MAMRTPGYLDGRRTRVGGVPIWSPVPDVLIPGSMEAYGVFEDFLSIEDLAAANSLAAGQSTWEFFIVVAATIIQANVAGGVAIIAVPATDEDSGQIIMGSNTGGGAFFPAATRHLWFEARVRAGLLGVPATMNYFIGLVTPAAAAILAAGGGALPNNLLGFVKRDIALEVNWSFVGRNVAAEDMNALGAGCVVDNLYHTFGFYINGVTDVTVYYDRVAIAAGAIGTANIPITGLMPAIAIRTGDPAPAADNISVDYIMCVQLR